MRTKESLLANKSHVFSVEEEEEKEDKNNEILKGLNYDDDEEEEKQQLDKSLPRDSFINQQSKQQFEAKPIQQNEELKSKHQFVNISPVYDKSIQDESKDRYSMSNTRPHTVSKQHNQVSEFDSSTLAIPQDQLNSFQTTTINIPQNQINTVKMSNFTHNNYNPDILDEINDSQLEQELAQDDSLHTIQNLRVNKTEDEEKLLKMDKSDIIKYYESLLDKCQETILTKRDTIRQLKESKLSLNFQISRTQRTNNELLNQVEQLKKDFQGRLLIVQREKEALQNQFFAKESLVKQYAQAFEDLKCKSYQLENVAFTYHMTVQRLKEREIELSQKLEDSMNNNMKMETALRLKHEEVYQLSKEKEQILIEARGQLGFIGSLKQEIEQIIIQRDMAEKEIEELKERIADLNGKINKHKLESQRNQRDNSTIKNSRASYVGNFEDQLHVEEPPAQESKISWLSAKPNNSNLRVSFQQQEPKSQYLENIRNSQRLNAPNNKEEKINTSAIKQQVRRDISNDSNPFNSNYNSFSPQRQNPSPIRLNQSPPKPNDNYLSVGDSNFGQNNRTRSRGSNYDTNNENDHEEEDQSMYMQNKIKQQTSQLGGVFNWDQQEAEPIFNIRNVAKDYKHRDKNVSKSFLQSPTKFQIRNQGEEVHEYQTPTQVRRVQDSRRSCSYMGVGERDIEQDLSNEKGIQPNQRSRNSTNNKRGTQNASLDFNTELNATLTSLQIEKQRLDGEYNKLRFSQVSTKPDLRRKKEELEVEIQQREHQISNLKLRIRDIKSQPVY